MHEVRILTCLPWDTALGLPIRIIIVMTTLLTIYGTYTFSESRLVVEIILLPPNFSMHGGVISVWHKIIILQTVSYSDEQSSGIISTYINTPTGRFTSLPFAYVSYSKHAAAPIINIPADCSTTKTALPYNNIALSYLRYNELTS